MRLREYLKKYKITYKTFGKRVGVSDAHITNIINNERNPSPHLMKKIEDVTKGEVTMQELFNPEAPTRLKRMENKDNENT